MDREHDQEVVVPEHGEHTPAEPRDPSEVMSATRAVGIRQPPLMVVTTPHSRVWFLVNLN